MAGRLTSARAPADDALASYGANRLLKVNDRRWGDKQTFILKNDESPWRRSWSPDASKPVSLDCLMGNTDSYGFSFAGFSSEVTGKVSAGNSKSSLRADDNRPSSRPGG